MSLTTRNRVKAKLGITVTTYDSKIDEMLDIVTNLINEYCNRIFGADDYKTWLNGYGTSELFLPQYPINSIDRVSIHKVYVGTVQCSASGATKAYITIDDTQMKFDYMKSDGTRQSDTLAFATYKKMSTLAAAAPSGWAINVQSGYGNWPTLDLIRVQSADCLTPISFQLEMADEEIGVELGRYDNGLIMAIDNVFPGGRKNIYIEYNAGYTEPTDSPVVAGNVPAGLESVAIEAVWNGVKGLKSDRSMKSEKFGDYSYTRQSNGTDIILTDSLMKRLDPWKKIIL